MDKKQLQALANELAKNLKIPVDLSQFDLLMKKIGVETALNAEMCHLRATINISPHRGLTPVTHRHVLSGGHLHVLPAGKHHHFRAAAPECMGIGLLPPFVVARELTKASWLKLCRE